ncbi:MAG: hypothetical protein QXE48_01375 [Nitrososphaerota archaeon]
MLSSEKIKVTIINDGKTIEFEGSYEEVWMSVNKYFSELYPTFKIVKKLTGAVDIKELAEKLAGKIEIREGRINIVSSGDAKKKILLCLAGAYIGKTLGLLEKDFLTPKEISNCTGIDEKITRARLSDLRKQGLVIKKEDGLYGFTPASLKEILETE